MEVPALVVLGWWFIQQSFYGVAMLSETAAGGVAFWAYIGGFGVGMISIMPFSGGARRRQHRLRFDEFEARAPAR